MSQHDMILDNASGASFRADANDALQALVTTSKGNNRPGTPYAGQHWVDDNTPSTNVWTENVYDGGADIPTFRIDTTNDRAIPYNAMHGRCRLAKSGSNLLLSPFDGNILIINGAPEVVPSAGVSLAATGLTPGTTYYIYAYMNGATMMLEASATGYAAGTISGVTIKSGDGTRTLVGMARPIAGPAWQDTPTQRFVLSWFNRHRIGLEAIFSTNRSTSSNSFIELHSEIRTQFLTWGEAVTSTATGALILDTINQSQQTAIGYDGTTAENGVSVATASSATGFIPFSVSVGRALSEGYHYAALLGTVSGGASGTWQSGYCSLRTWIYG